MYGFRLLQLVTRAVQWLGGNIPMNVDVKTTNLALTRGSSWLNICTMVSYHSTMNEPCTTSYKLKTRNSQLMNMLRNSSIWQQGWHWVKPKNNLSLASLEDYVCNYKSPSHNSTRILCWRLTNISSMWRSNSDLLGTQPCVNAFKFQVILRKTLPQNELHNVLILQNRDRTHTPSPFLGQLIPMAMPFVESLMENEISYKRHAPSK